MVKKVIEIDVDVLNAQGGLDKFVDTLKETEQQSVSLKTELRKLKEQLATLPEGTAEYDKIAKKAGEVSDKLGDINTKVKNLGSDTKGIDAVVQGAQTLSGAFSVASSASALLGDENEDLQKTMLKVESAIGLTVGIQSIANALQKESALVLGVQSVATKVQIALQTAYTAVVGTSTGALKALKVALISTGIGAFVVLLGSLIASMSSSTEATDELTDAQERYNKELEYSKELTEDAIRRNEYQTQIALAKAKKRGASESELLRIELDGIEKRAKANAQEIREISANKDSEYGLTKEQNKRIQDLRNQNIELQRQGNIKIAQFEADFATQQRDAREKIEQDRIKKNEEQRKQREEALKKEREQYLQDLKEFQAKIREAETEERLKVIDERFAQAENQLAWQKEIAEKSDKIDAEYEAKKLQRAKLTEEQKLGMLGVSFGKISELLGKNSKAGKAFAVSQALINTYQGITAELATKTATPFEFGVKLVNIASVVGIGFKAVKDILKTPDMSTGGGGASAGGGGGGAPSSAPQFNVVGNAGLNQIATTLGKEQPPLQAFVVGNKVTTQQALDRNIVNNASL